MRKVGKTKPVKLIPETDVIFEQIHQVNQEADKDPYSLRISIDAKVGVNIGEYDRGGKTRVLTQALDHDFAPELTLTPYGIFAPELNELFIFFVSSKLTADCIVDMIEQWWEQVSARFSHIQRLIINQDNGPESNSHRTQFMSRIVDFASKSKLTLQLAYYPPYHSKYNPVERTFGWLEKHWNGSLLDSVDTVLQFAKTLSFKGNHPVVTLVEKVYNTGVKLSKDAMTKIEAQIKRLPSLPKWFVEITGNTP